MNILKIDINYLKTGKTNEEGSGGSTQEHIFNVC